jgi:lipopolysaccharide export system permease protein
MGRKRKMSISKYLSYNFTSSFLTIFLPLFFIGALVFIIKISALTASIQISFIEMLQLFSYNIPAILFYTIPISFLVAVVTTLLRLSNDNELMALFALGKKSKSIMNSFLFISILFSTVLLILSLGLMPKTKQQFKAFKHLKASEAQVNINPSKLGQKFGNLFVYVKEKDNNTLHNVVIYNKDKKHSDQLFMAKSANIKNEDAVITLSLNNGSGYTFTEESLKEIRYEKMQVFQNLNTEEFTYQNIFDYWIKLSFDSDDKRKILFFIYISFIPLIALYIIAAFSIINPRYQKNYAFHILGATTVGLYSIATLLKSQGNYIALLIAIILTFILGLFLFKRNVQRYF